MFLQGTLGRVAGEEGFIASSALAHGCGMSLTGRGVDRGRRMAESPQVTSAVVTRA